MVNPTRYLKPDVEVVDGKEYHVLKDRDGKVVAWLHNDAFTPDARRLDFYGLTDAHLELDDSVRRQDRARELKEAAKAHGYGHQLSLYCFATMEGSTVRRRTDIMYAEAPMQEEIQRTMDFFARNHRRLNETVYVYWRGRVIPAEVHLKFLSALEEAALIPIWWAEGP